VEARLAVGVGEGCSLPRTVPAEQLKIIDCLGQVRENIGVVVTSDSDEGNTSPASVVATDSTAPNASALFCFRGQQGHPQRRPHPLPE